VRVGFRLIITRYWLPRPDRTLQRLFPDGNRFAGSLSFRRMTSSYPLPALSYSCSPRISDQSHSTVARSKMAPCFAQSKMYAPNMMAVSKHRETSAGATLRAALCDRSTSRFFANLHTICWFQSSQCHRGVPSRAFNTIGRRRCRTNLRGSPEMRFVSTALVMMTIALMLLAEMLLGPVAHAKSDDLRSEPCWCK
jgi:hypothetical protein